MLLLGWVITYERLIHPYHRTGISICQPQQLPKLKEQTVPFRVLQEALADKDPGNMAFPSISPPQHPSWSQGYQQHFVPPCQAVHPLPLIICNRSISSGLMGYTQVLSPGLLPATHAVFPSWASSFNPYIPHCAPTGTAQEHHYEHRQLSLLTKTDVQNASCNHMNGIPTLDIN